jgi:hypothetical protein
MMDTLVFENKNWTHSQGLFFPFSNRTKWVFSNIAKWCNFDQFIWKHPCTSSHWIQVIRYYFLRPKLLFILEKGTEITDKFITNI